MNKLKRKLNKIKRRTLIELNENTYRDLDFETNNWDMERAKKAKLPSFPAFKLTYHSDRKQTLVFIQFCENGESKEFFTPGRLDLIDAKALLKVVNRYIHKPVTPRKEKLLIDTITKLLDCYEPL